MNRQRFAVVILAIIGMISTFLPWYRIHTVGTLSGVSYFVGWFTFVMFIIAIILALRKNLKEDMSMGVSWSVTIFSLLGSFAGLWKMIDIWFAKEEMVSLGGNMKGIMAGQVTVGYGAWIVVIAGICIPFAAYLFRDRSFHRV